MFNISRTVKRVYRTAKHIYDEPFSSAANKSFNTADYINRHYVNTSSRTRTPRFGDTSKTTKAGNWVGKAIRKPYVNMPLTVGALAGVGLYAGSAGFAKEIVNSPVGQDYLQLYSPSGRFENESAVPLGYPSEINPYSVNPQTSNLGATGELALALFKTRHGR